MANINIFGTLHNVTGDPIVKAAQVKDESQNTYQSDINADIISRVNALEQAGGGGTSFSGSASDVTYSNITSGLAATNVQDAIDKLKEKQFSGVYDDLTGKPTIPTTVASLSDSSEYAKKSEVPTKVSQLTNDSGFLTDIVNRSVTEEKLSDDLSSSLNVMRSKLDILYKVSVSLSGGGNKKKGTSVNVTLTWTVQVNGSNVNPNSQVLNGEVLDNSVRSKTFYGVTTNTTYTLVVDGVTKSVNVNFYNPVYYGAVADNYTISNDVTGLSQYTTYGTRASNITTTLNNQKFVYLYPSAFGALTSIKDGNNFEYLSDFTKVTGLTINGESYIGYIKNSASTGSVTFKFS